VIGVGRAGVADVGEIPMPTARPARNFCGLADRRRRR
jgi:hypothetical protein